MAKRKHGGKREGAGRPKGSAKPPTKVLAVRVPASEYERLKEAVVALVGRLLARD